MCELHSITTNREAMRRIAQSLGAALDDGYQPHPVVRRSQPVSILCNTEAGLVWQQARLGMPTPPERLKPNAKVDPGIANVANPLYRHWRRWLGPEHRCVIPATGFVEHDSKSGTYAPVDFAFGEGHPLFFFAGIWADWTGVRKRDEGERTHRLYAILTTRANGDISPVNDRMPAILLSPEEVSTWLHAPAEQALTLQRPLLDGSLVRLGVPTVQAEDD